MSEAVRKGPRYLGIAIGLGICLLLLLLSGGSVLLLNLKRSDAIYRLRALKNWTSKKEDEQKFSKIATQRPKLKLLPMTMEKLSSMSQTAC